MLPLKTPSGRLSLGMLKFYLENRCKDLPDDTPVLFYDDKRNLVTLDSIPHRVDVRKRDGGYVSSHSKVYDDTFKAVVLTK